MRITTGGEFISLFAEVGAGWYIQVTDIEITGILLGNEFVQTVSETNNRLGFSFGLGLETFEIYGARLELIPVYHVLASPQGPYQYYTVDLMATYGIF